MSGAATGGVRRVRTFASWLVGAFVALHAPVAAQSRLFATRPGEGDVVAIDLATGAVAASFDAGSLPAGAVLSADGSRIYVADATKGELHVFDTAGAEIESVAVGAGPAGVALCTGGARVAVALAGADAIAVVDTATLGIVDTLPVGDQPVAVACADGFLAAASYGAGTVSIFDATTLASLGTAPVGPFPAGVAIAAGRAWVPSLFDSTVTVVTLLTATVASTVPVGAAPRGIAAAAGRVFVADVDDGALTVLDAVSAGVVGTVALPHAAPTDVLVDVTTGNVLVAHLGEPAISVVDPASLTVTGTVAAPVGLLSLAGVGLGGGVVPIDVPAVGPLGLLLLAAALAWLGVRRRLGLAAALLLAAIASGAAARAQTATFTDSTFSDADWSVFSATGSHTEGQTAAGNPAPSRQMMHFQDPNETVRVFHRWLTATYDPATSGTVATLDVSRDRRTCGGDAPLGEVLESFVVYQGGTAYSTSESTFSSAAWTTFAQNGLTAQDFTDDTSNHPDFSSSGGPISFGYARTTTSTGAATFAATCHAIDNLTVTVEAKPPAGTSTVGFAQRDYFVLEGDDVAVRVRRSGDLTAPASVDVLMPVPLSPGVVKTVTWAAGTGGEATATFTPADLGGSGLLVRTLQLQGPSPGATIDAGANRAMIYHGTDALDGLWAILIALLARWDLAGLVLLGLAAAFTVVRRRQQRAGHGAGESAVEMGVDRRLPSQRGGGGPPDGALGGQLDRQGGEQHDTGAAVSPQRGHTAGREQTMEQRGEPGHRGDARRQQEHAERGAQRGGQSGDSPGARAQLAADGQRDQRETGEVPSQVHRAGVYEVRAEQPPELAAQHGGAHVGERGEAARSVGGCCRGGEAQRQEDGVAAQVAARSWHTWYIGRAQVALWLLLAAPALVASWGCVGVKDGTIKFAAAHFNDRIAGDLQGLSPQERDTDLRYGIFRDGSGDPDGAGPRQRGLVSEIFPVAAASSDGPGNLIQTPCLFSGRRGGTSDELRLTWELVETIDRESGEYFKDALVEGHADVGLCTFSSPELRLLFEDPDAPQPSVSQWTAAARDCSVATQTSGAGGFSFALTFREDPEDNTRNQPWSCRLGNLPWTRVDAFGPAGPNPDASCPAEAFTAGPAPAGVFGCVTQNGLLPSCALPACGVQPAADTSYRVSVDPSTMLPPAERWLQPSVLVVDGTRTMVRRMDVPGGSGPLAFAWQTKVTRRGGGMEGPVQWAENFSPTVQVDTVQIVSRNSSGGAEQVETPALGRLTIDVPRAGSSMLTSLQCAGQNKPNGFTFTIADCRVLPELHDPLVPLTPTYLVANLHLDPPTETPITWRATLSQLGNGRQAFIKFGLRVQTVPAAMRMSPMHNFGRRPHTERYRQGTVEIENVGGENVNVNTVDLVPGLGQPQDFSFFVVGDPVPVPMPFETKTQSDGSMEWWLGDLRDVPLLAVDETAAAATLTVGDGAAAPGQPQRFTLYGQGTQLRGGVLTRDDPRAVFTAAPTSYPRPLSFPAFAELVPPFVLRPGERRTIVVETRPSALGVRLATLRVRGTPASNPTTTLEVRSQLQVEVVTGPLLVYMPYSLYVYRDENGSQPGHRTALLENAGNSDLTVSSIGLTGAGASRFTLSTDRGSLGPFVLHSGDSALLRLEYVPECDGVYGSGPSALDHQATIVVASTGGNASIPVGGASQGFCP